MAIPKTKVCKHCNIEKPASEFTRIKAVPKIRHESLLSKCKPCIAAIKRGKPRRSNKETDRIWRQNNKHRARGYYQKRKQKWIEFMKTKQCARCGNDDYRVLCWHHPNPDEKEMSIGVVSNSVRWERVMAEVAKCVCLCANCHIIVHKENEELKPSPSREFKTKDRYIRPTADSKTEVGE